MSGEKKKIRIRCGSCNTENVARDAEARWDFDAQEWGLSAVFDAGYCHNDECPHSGSDATLIEEVTDEVVAERVKVVCPMCGSENVTGLGTIRWNTESQEWVNCDEDGPENRMLCNNCEYENWMDIIPVGQEPTLHHYCKHDQGGMAKVEGKEEDCPKCNPPDVEDAVAPDIRGHVHRIIAKEEGWTPPEPVSPEKDPEHTCDGMWRMMIPDPNRDFCEGCGATRRHVEGTE